jgi:lipopolysaccharide/colanic/teichoic acid biosynthesis glycosyltransferase
MSTHLEIFKQNFPNSKSEVSKAKFLAKISQVPQKKNCLVVNPGILTKELLKEKSFNELFTHKTWSNSKDGVLLEDELKRDYQIVLIDHTGNFQMSDDVLQRLNSMRMRGEPVYSLLSFYEHLTKRIPLVHLSSEWIVNDTLFIVSDRKDEFLATKRFFDLLIATITLPLSLPFFTLGILLTRLTSAGPVLFKQKRVGKNGKIFELYKIRTMQHKVGGHTGFTVKNDDRITPLGKFLRLTKIDELPQLFNIFVGDMSLIGPRPERSDIVEAYKKINPYYDMRHVIKPGISGWAQVNHPTATPEENLQKLEYDLYYVKNMSFNLDMRILYKTCKVIITLDSL